MDLGKSVCLRIFISLKRVYMFYEKKRERIFRNDRKK